MTIDKRKSKNLAKIKQIMKDNPDLPYEFVRQLLMAQEQVNVGRVEPFDFN